MKIPSIPSEYIIYALAAVGIGMVFSFGFVGAFHQQVPLQVQLTQYQPLAPPAPAEPTLAPQPVPGSAAAAQKSDPKDKFAPAQAPVVVTTQPLPTITPEPTPEQGPNVCSVTAGGDVRGLRCTYANMLENMRSAFSILGVMVLFAGVVVILYAFTNGAGGSGLLVHAFISIIVGGMFLLLGAVIMNAMSAAILSGLPP